MSVSARLQELGIVLPEPARPVATYVRYVQTGNLLFISGTGPGPEIRAGKLGADMTVEDGYAAARSVGLSILATAQDALGDLDRVKTAGEIAWHGQLDSRFHRSTEGYQRLL